jgi:hypothetical protein
MTEDYDNIKRIAEELRTCACSWEPNAKLLGNVSAKDRDKELLSINSGYDELRTVYNELKKIFDSGIRSTESFESAKDYNHIYAPGTK